MKRIEGQKQVSKTKSGLSVLFVLISFISLSMITYLFLQLIVLK